LSTGTKTTLQTISRVSHSAGARFCVVAKKEEKSSSAAPAIYFRQHVEVF
jgi:hypothetical protein